MAAAPTATHASNVATEFTTSLTEGFQYEIVGHVLGKMYREGAINVLRWLYVVEIEGVVVVQVKANLAHVCTT